MTRLDQLTIGQTGIIATVGGATALQQRLLEMGLMEGEPLEVLAIAPLGDPLEIRVGQTRLSLRRQEAAVITVRPGD